MVLVDENGIVALVNAQTEEMFGYPRDELIGRPVELLIPERFRNQHPSYRASFAAKPRVRPMGVGLELAGRRRDGSEIPVDIRLSPVVIGDETLVSASVRDVSRQKAQERELEKARRVAEVASQAKSRFLAVASHDLRQPVQAARNYLHILERQLGAKSPATLGKLHAALETHCEQLDRLLSIARLEAGGVQPERRAASLGALFAGLHDEQLPAAENKGLELRSIPSSLVVDTDPRLLRQLLQNLLSNAIRYTRRGRVVLGCRRSFDHARIQVLDTGIGIPADRVEQIFAEFYQVENDAPERQRGLGLGLSIVKRLSELLDHPIDVRSAPGRGSAFEVRVPLAASELGDTRNRPELRTAAQALIVVIDDDPLVLDSIIDLLTLGGHKVIAGEGAAAVYGALRTAGRVPDVILSDYQLEGGVTGPEVIDELRQLLGDEIPAILLTGDSSSERLDDARRSGFRLLAKPVSPDVLEKVIASTLADKSSSKRTRYRCTAAVANDHDRS